MLSLVSSLSSHFYSKRRTSRSCTCRSRAVEATRDASSHRLTSCYFYLADIEMTNADQRTLVGLMNALIGQFDADSD